MEPRIGIRVVGIIRPSPWIALSLTNGKIRAIETLRAVVCSVKSHVEGWLEVSLR